MSINWVMLPPTPSPAQPFTPLSGEQTLYVSPPRTAFNISTVAKFPAHQPFSLSSSTGTLYLTSKRVIYLPTTTTTQLQTFSSPLLNLQDSHVSAPWIGPNVWSAVVKPVQGGNLPNQALEVKFTFKDGGAYDYQTRYEQVRDRVVQAVERARERGQGMGLEGVEAGRGRGPGVMEGVEVVLEDLPRYEEARQIPGAHVDVAAADAQGTSELVGAAQAVRTNSIGTGTGSQSRDETVFTPPDEPPPGYDQVQREAIEDEFSRSLAQRLETRGESHSR